MLARDPNPKVIELLATGPLEDLLVDHGLTVIDEIENEAKTNRRVAVLLGGVWQSEMDDRVFLPGMV